MILRIAAFILFMLAAQGVYANDKSIFYQNGNALIKYCESENATERVICMAYLAGTIDTTEAWVISGKVERIICKPQEVTVRQLKKIFISYGNRHPEDLHLAASSIALAAYIDAFPCG